MGVSALFPTLLYEAPLGGRGARDLDRRLLDEAYQLREDDAAGRRWSTRNYHGGYTSYGSASRLQRISPSFAALERRLDRHVRAFAARLEWDLTGRTLAMTDCWVNIMPRGVAHGSHLHPLASVSGTYYLRTPRGAPGIKFEDPRLDRFMGAPPRRADASPAQRPWVTRPVNAGRLVLFESWLRHEIAANPVAAERVSVSFNYHWC